MSLDVYLTLPDARVTNAPAKVERIYVREGGGTREITRAEWDEMHPGREPVVVLEEMDGSEVYTGNITHNLVEMAKECDLYQPLWAPEEIGATRARDLIQPLLRGLVRLHDERERLEEFNPKNGWGDYDSLYHFATSYHAACEEWPDAEIEVSR